MQNKRANNFEVEVNGLVFSFSGFSFVANLDDVTEYKDGFEKKYQKTLRELRSRYESDGTKIIAIPGHKDVDLIAVNQKEELFFIEVKEFSGGSGRKGFMELLNGEKFDSTDPKYLGTIALEKFIDAFFALPFLVKQRQATHHLGPPGDALCSWMRKPERKLHYLLWIHSADSGLDHRRIDAQFNAMRDYLNRNLNFSGGAQALRVQVGLTPELQQLYPIRVTKPA